MTRKIRNGLIIPNQREQEMHDYLFHGGHTLQECGDFFGITRERVRQIIGTRYGITNNDNDAKWSKSVLIEYLKEKERVNKSRRRKEAIFFKYFGCHEEIVTRINGEPFTWTKDGLRSLAGEYINQQRSADVRGIRWNINFRQWWLVWDESGKYNQRGRRKGQYVMARWGDCGAYELGNVYICKTEDNIRDIYLNKSDEELDNIKKKQSDTHKRNYIPRTYCSKGHELSGSNLYIYAPTGQRYCRECTRIRQRAKYYKKANSGSMFAEAATA